jgi:cell shape-determining protein MreC
MTKRHADDVTLDYIIRLRKLEQENERLKKALLEIKQTSSEERIRAKANAALKEGE